MSIEIFQTLSEAGLEEPPYWTFLAAFYWNERASIERDRKSSLEKYYQMYAYCEFAEFLRRMGIPAREKFNKERMGQVDLDILKSRECGRMIRAERQI